MSALPVPFVKMSGAGNDFVVIDNMQKTFAFDASRLSRTLCERHLGIGSDGLILIEPSERAHFKMLYYNADGSFGGMCGNGGRCAAVFAKGKGYTNSDFSFEAVGHIYTGSIDGPRVAMKMKDPAAFRDHISLGTASSPIEHGFFVNTGSPHAVLFVDDLEEIDVPIVGSMLRHHEAFTPEGTNVNFVQLLGSNRLRMRTYERGVEAETLACGTGAIASAITSSRVHGCVSPITVETRSRETLEVAFHIPEYTNVMLKGNAVITFWGNVLIDSISFHIYHYAQ